MRLPALLAAAAVAVASLQACSDPILGQASIVTLIDSLKAFALSGTPLGSASALSVGGRVVGRAQTNATGSTNFDIVFDLDNTGKILLYPAKVVSTDPRGSGRIVGLLATETPFNDVLEAPFGGYQYDSVTTVRVGQAVVIDSRSDYCSVNPFLPDQYAKMIVDSVHASDRQIFFRLVTDQNCGYRGLVPGEIPKR